MEAREIERLQNYFRQTFKLPEMRVVARTKKDDSAEVFIGDEFIGVLFRDEEDGELSYSFQMAILDFDLEE